MTINRENRVKVLQNLGQYLIDNADEFIPTDKNVRPTRQRIVIEVAVEIEIPHVIVETEYVADKTLRGVDWSSIT